METNPTLVNAPLLPSPAPERPASALSSDFETFLRMLTVQMKNQDPLNPIESSDFAVQLATFSGVEQQVKANELLARLADGFAASGMTGFASWIGREVRSSGPALFNGTPLTLYPGYDAFDGDKSFLVVRDASGLPVARSAVSPGADPLSWAGVGLDGTPFEPGLYSFEIERMKGEDVVGTRRVEHYARVNEVQSGPTGPMLVLDGGATVTAKDVLAVRAVID